jgi:hypothetical protein
MDSVQPFRNAWNANERRISAMIQTEFSLCVSTRADGEEAKAAYLELGESRR